ncbi:Hsp20/alpha crystallin family protein [Halalkalicoccus jeotgali]|uniref:Heat shock protein Hsp20 n=1 Tax=Halalkalicoccus jeotgali (strain DSM 18796 / CECT 7217 / JCM 14584 / KCTC 4019 / B3) TaxID=795797 RepID=D8JA83_HALJB|nr:Hsp20/alpha crystallin family protein [Halalkalicoccus jeotgali]ADJ14605.1 heat shock protein Hsp20 [Halalkalicoccus jeotgali B3]ELY39978.1 heat shock protein Hsp20 [Halalkalicoccus jeotgali B3]
MSALREALRELPEAVFADLLEGEEAYLVVIDLPGTTGETTEITTEDRRIRVEARREKTVPADFEYVREDRSLFVDLDLPLPPDAIGEDAHATLDQGVLELEIPRRPPTEETIIPIEDA